ncbi:putative membrane protein [Acidisarcina polymorpha]|uniref:Putative membrane protein n=2 Tax=Acidisarcina polymorpha TaxID=2211140 RepID=A0A2Z5FVB2_9BACT|nr:putative membrane protein [Acidisarcina polymorpha]
MEFMDFLRGTAALVVAVQHCGENLFPKFAKFTHDYFSFGKLGLVIFFLVSGFVIPLSIEKGHSLKRFWVQRFFRLFPLYWVSLAAVVIIYLLGYTPIFDPPFRAHLWRNVLVNVTMFQGAFRVPQAIGLYYTLTIEMFFYIACSLLLLIKQLRNTYALTWVLLVAVSALWILGPLVFHRRMEMAGLFYGVTLFCGTAIYRYYKGNISAKAMNALMGALLLSVSVGVYLNYVYTKKVEMQFSYVAVFGPWFVGFVMFFAAYALRNREFPAVGMWLGRISYSVYLVHPIISFLFRYGRTGGIGLFLITIAVTLLVATVTYYAIEKPMIDLGHRIVKRKQLIAA